MAKITASAHHHGPAPHGPVHFTAPKKHGHGGLIAALVAALLLAAVALWLWLPGAAKPDPTEALLDQMRAAAAGTVAPKHAFGGTLSVLRANGRNTVIAAGLPSKACVQVGWRLAREGTIIVDGVLPQRLSAAKLSELCAGDGATLTWVPGE